MKNYKNLYLMLLVLCGISGSIALLSGSNGVVINTIAENSGKPLFMAVNNTSQGETLIDFALDGYTLEQVSEENETYTKVRCGGYGLTQTAGLPELPIISKMVAVPFEGNYSVEVIDIEFQTIKDVKVYPAQKLVYESAAEQKTPFVINKEFYSAAKLYPQKEVKAGNVAFLRDYRVLNVDLNPFQYNATTKELRVMTNAKIRVKYSAGAKFTQGERKISRVFEPLYKSVIANYASLPKGEYQKPSYLIIYPNQTGVADIVKYLTDWRHQQGFVVTSVSTTVTGTTLSSIKAYIQNLYNTSINPPDFITLAGDGDGSYVIPSGYSDGDGDQIYGLLAGNDILADAYVGRLSFGTLTHLQTIVAKTIKYEQTPYMTNTAWLNRAVLVGDPSTSGESCISTNRYIRSIIENSERDYTFAEEYSGNYSSAMTNGINAGAAMFNYRGWYGMSNWSNSNINALTNGPMMPVAMMITCGTGEFVDGESRSEAIIRLGTAAAFKGAVAAVGASTIHTHTCYNNIIDAGIFSAIFNNKLYYVGGALNNGKVQLYNSYPDNQAGAVEDFSYWMNLMGDPALHVWTNIPQTLTVTHSANINTATNFIEVTVKNSDAQLMSDAWVTLLKGNDEVFVSGYTNSNGKIVLPVRASSEGSMKITVTKHNCIPYLGTITVANSTSQVTATSTVIDDDSNGSSVGNGNQEINPGETIELKVQLKSNGTTAYNGVNATISTTDDFLTIENGNAVYGNMAAGATSASTSPFLVKFKTNAIGSQQAVLKIVAKDSGTNQWTDFIYLMVKGPNLSVTGTTAVAVNGIILPGATVDFSVKVKNSGTIAASGISGILSSTDSRVTVNDNSGVFGTIAPAATVENTGDKFKITASAILLPGMQIPLTLKLTSAGGYDNTVTLMVAIGQVQQKDPLGTDAFGHYIFDSGDTGYEMAPVYNWVEIDPSYGGSGTNTNLSSSGNGGSIKVVDLPFNMMFYGKPYSKLTICSNGWLSPGTSNQTSYMNWHVPSPLGPSPMIAAFWDDLKTDNSGKVLYYYDAANKRFIVEWSKMTNDYNNAEETFQAIIYNPAYQANSQGESDIVLQYKTFNNSDAGTYGGSDVSHGEYATVGIESHNEIDGLEYTYANRYPAAAKPLANGMALKITCAPMPHNEAYLTLQEIKVEGGNGNTIPESGENIKLKIVVNNSGNNAAEGVTSLLSTSSAFTTITQNSSTYANIDGQSSGTNLTDFAVSLSPNCTDGQVVEMLLKVTTSTAVFNIPVNLIVRKAVLDVKNVTISDNANNILDPAETVNLVISLFNAGGGDASNVTGTLTTTNSLITINQNSASQSVITPGNAKNFSYSITTAAALQVGAMVSFNLAVVADGISVNRTVVVPVGMILETFESGNFSSFTWNNTSSSPWTITNSAPYAGTYSAKSGVITDNQTSSLKIQIEVENTTKSGAGEPSSKVTPTIQFYKKTSSEESYDNLIFLIDGVEQGRWSGTANWSLSSYDIQPGVHSLEWQYNKDNVESGGEDCVWLDNIKFPKMHTPVYTEIALNQSAVNGVALTGDSVSYNLKISNLGNENLTYFLTKTYQTAPTRNAGGPDTFGYTWKDSQESNGPVYNWLTRPASATKLVFANNTNSSTLLPIGFNFNFYGQVYTQFRVSPDGWVGFGEDNVLWQNGTIPATEAPKPALLAFWDDLNPLNTASNDGTAGGEIFYQTDAEKVTVWYENVKHWNTQPGTYTFQVIFYKNGKVVYQYANMVNLINSATIGIQNGNGADGLQVVSNQAYMQNNLRIEFSRPSDWFNFTAASGTVSAGQFKDVSLKLNAKDLSSGTFRCKLNITSNDLDEPSIDIPVTFYVVSQINGAIAVSADTINFGDCAKDSVYTDSLTISNTGSGPVGITELLVTNNKFFADIASFGLNSGDSKKIGVKFSSNVSETYTGELVIHTNSVATPEKRVFLKAVVHDSLGMNENLPLNWSLAQNYPNPFNPLTNIQYAVKDGYFGNVKLTIFNVKGEKFAVLVNSQHKPGIYSVAFQAARMSSGVYYYQLETKDFSAIKKMMILK